MVLRHYITATPAVEAAERDLTNRSEGYAEAGATKCSDEHSSISELKLTK
jgi:hypothetical protein